MSERAAIYVRVSSAGQAEEGTSLETQEQRCRTFCQEKGYGIVGVFRDVSSGAEWRDRKGLSEARQLIRDGAATVLLSYAIDRLSRHQTGLAILSEEAEEHGARLEFVTESFEDSAVGRFIRGAKAFAAEVEREKIIERTGRGLRARVASGKPLAGIKPPYGYRWKDEAKSGLVVCEDEAAVVRRVYRDLVAGESAAAIARALTAEGIPSPTGLPRWGAGVLCVLVRHPAYKGQAVSYRWKMLKKRPGTKRPGRAERPPEEWAALPDGTAPALVSPRQWERAIRALEGLVTPGSRPGPKSAHRLLAGGFAVCGSCGGTLVGSSGRDGWRSYVCGANKRVTSEGCASPVTISQARIDAAVWQHIRDTFGDPRKLASLLARARTKEAKQHPAADARFLARKLAECDRRAANLTRSLAGADDEDEAAAIRKELRDVLAEKRRHERERDEANVRQRGSRLADLDALTDAPLVVERAGQDHARKRKALALFGVRVTVFRGDLRTARRTGERWRITSLLGD